MASGDQEKASSRPITQEERLADLDARLMRLPEKACDNYHASAQTATNNTSTSNARGNKSPRDSSSYALASRIAADLIAGVAVCLFLAWCIANFWWPEYQALIMAAGCVCGVGIGIYNVWRSANHHFNPPAPPE